MPQDGPFSDDFNRASWQTPGWNFLQPYGAVPVTLVNQNSANAALRFSLPNGVPHDAYENPDGGATGPLVPRLLQFIDDKDFAIEAKFDSPLNSGGNLHGLFLVLEHGGWIRLDVSRQFPDVLVYAAGFNAQGQIFDEDSKFYDDADWAPPHYLRITRTGNTFVFLDSHGTRDLEAMATITNSTPIVAVGVFAGNATGAVHVADVDYFRFDELPFVSPDP
jgi:hypothetical protein